MATTIPLRHALNELGWEERGERGRKRQEGGGGKHSLSIYLMSATEEETSKRKNWKKRGEL